VETKFSGLVGSETEVTFIRKETAQETNEVKEMTN
jgi:hypothetical protein